MTSVEEPQVVLRRRRRTPRRGDRIRPVAAVSAIVVVAVLGVLTWRIVSGSGAEALTARAEVEAGPGGVKSDGSTAEPSATEPPPTTTPTTTVPEITVGALEAKGRPVPVVFRIGTFDPVVFITIDDGGIQRPELVEYVRATGIPITMFLTERYTSGDSVGYFKQLQDLGATVQAHSITHTSLRGKSLEFQTKEVCQPVDSYERNYSVRPRYFRPPYGNYDTNTLLAAKSCGLKAVLWWSATYNNGTLALQEQPFRRGEIILMHFNDHLAADLETLVQQIEAAGLRPALLDDYLDAAPIQP
ncbi:MAG: polysaccharide deacetylase family protein [Actinobacteria bacterium]|nr:polysaccharide deacetylase family protein [Actinomycetota bacterium]